MADKSGAIDESDKARLSTDSAIIQDEVESTEADPVSLNAGGSDSWRLATGGRVLGSECGATQADELEEGPLPV